MLGDSQLEYEESDRGEDGDDPASASCASTSSAKILDVNVDCFLHKATKSQKHFDGTTLHSTDLHLMPKPVPPGPHSLATIT